MSKLRPREGRRLAQDIYGVGEEPRSLDSLPSALFERMGRIERGRVQTKKEREKRYEKMKEKRNRLGKRRKQETWSPSSFPNQEVRC